MQNTDRLPDALADYLALCLDDRAPEQRIGTAQQLRASAHTTEFYALRAAYRGCIARSTTPIPAHSPTSSTASSVGALAGSPWSSSAT